MGFFEGDETKEVPFGREVGIRDRRCLDRCQNIKSEKIFQYIYRSSSYISDRSFTSFEIRRFRKITGVSEVEIPLKRDFCKNDKTTLYIMILSDTFYTNDSRMGVTVFGLSESNDVGETCPSFTGGNLSDYSVSSY